MRDGDTRQTKSSRGVYNGAGRRKRFSVERRHMKPFAPL